MSKSLKISLAKLRLKHPLILKIFLMMILILLFVIFSSVLIRSFNLSDLDIFKFLDNSGSVAILASLLGATVGGAITYFVTIYSLIQSNHIKSAIINKKTIYEPLLIEFKSFSKDLSNNDVVQISFNSARRNRNFTQFEVWMRIKNDSRYYQMPSYLRENLLSLEEDVISYIKQMENVEQSAFNSLKKQIKNFGKEIASNEIGVRSFFNLEDLINRKQDILNEIIFNEGVLGIPDLTVDEKKNINEKFNEYLNVDHNIEEYFSIKNKVKLSLDDLVEILELIIITITNKYERKSSLF